MKLSVIILFILVTFAYNPFLLLQVWLVTTPIVSNFILMPQENPLFGSVRLEHYLTGSAPGLELRELFNFDRIILALLFLIAVISAKQPQVGGQKLDRAFMFLIATLFISSIASDNPIHSMKVIIDSFVLCFMAYYLGKNFINTPERTAGFRRSVVIFGILMGIIGIVEKLIYGANPMYRITGPFRFWENYGLAMALVFFYLLFLFSSTDKSRKSLRFLYLFLLGITSYCVFLTQTRTIMLSIIISLVFCTYLGRALIDRASIAKIVAALMVVAFVLVANPMLLKSTSFYQHRLTKKETFAGRQETYVAAWRMFKSNPLFGIGLKNFKYKMEDYMSDDEVRFSVFGKTTLHNSYFVLAAETGLAGVLAMGFIGLYSLRAAFLYFRRAECLVDKYWGLTMVAIITTYFLSAMTFDIFFEPTIDNRLFYISIGWTVGQLGRIA